MATHRAHQDVLHLVHLSIPNAGAPKLTIGQLVKSGEGVLTGEELADQWREKSIPSQGVFRHTSK